MRLTSAIVLLVLCTYEVAGNNKIAVKYTSCSTGGGNVTEVRVHPCEKEPCKIPKGEKTNVEVDFIPNKDVTSLKLSVTARLFDLDIPFPGSENIVNVCVKHGLTCPITKGKKETLEMVLDVPNVSPSVQTTATFKLEDNENKGLVFCFEAPVTVM